MRLPLVCATFVAGLIVVLGLSAQQPGGPPPGGNRPPPTGGAAPPSLDTSVVVIDIAFIFKNHVRFNQRMNDIKRDIQQYDAYAQEEAKKLNTKGERLTQFNAGSPDYKKLEEELTRDKADLQIKAGIKRKEFLEQEAKVYYDTYREIEQTVKVFAERNRIGMVLRYSADDMKPDDRNSILQGVNKPVVFQQGRDITEYILNMLNAGSAQAARPNVPPQGAPAAPPAGGPIIPGAPPRAGTIQR